MFGYWKTEQTTVKTECGQGSFCVDSVPNAYALQCIWFIFGVIIVFLILQLTHIDIVDNRIALPGILGAGTTVLVAELFGFFVDHRKKWLKYVLIFLSVLGVTIAGVFLTYHTVLATILPLLIAAQYSQKRVIWYSFALSVVSIITIAVLGYEYGLCDANMVIQTVSKVSEYNGVLSSVIPSTQERLPTLLLFFALPRCLIILAFVPMVSAIADNKKKIIMRETEIRYLGEHDRMTGFYNREKYTTMIHKVYSTLQKVAVVYFDVNNLKDVNDAYGHDHGDELLMRASESIHSVMECSMDAYRLGGDEFAVVIPGGDEIAAQKLLADWNRALGALNSMHEVPCLVAYGYATGEGKNFNEVVTSADRNMYDNKMKTKHRERRINA